ncbi:MAG: HupE/UreJ family protein [Alphaproteobacteria bacterium]|nr:HupE/UreJ family protein [Alphaproteobacteria bacterium]
MKKILYFFVLGLSIFVQNSAYAHTGHQLSYSVLSGFLHPFNGIDHILVMLAIGLWSTQLSTRTIWIFPLTFVFFVLIGGILGQYLSVTGISFSFHEIIIILSVIVTGLIIARFIILPQTISLGLITLFGLAHGLAHGIETPNDHSFYLYGLGFITATILLHLAGILLGYFIHHYKFYRLYRISGLITTVIGLNLLVTYSL